MKVKVIVISDDFTGAAEVAGAAYQLGLSAEVHVGKLHDCHADVVAIDTNTRSLSSHAASRVVSDLVTRLPVSKDYLLMKKVDSVLRGPILAELVAVAKTTAFDRCLLVCGNPRKSRLVLNGQLYLNSQPLSVTEFAEDFEYPCRTGDVVELLTSNSRDLILDANTFGNTIQVIHPGDPLLCGVSIGNVKDEKDIDRFADSWMQQRKVALAAGAAEFIEALIRRVFRTSTPRPILPTSFAEVCTRSKTLLITGTRNPQATGWPVIYLQPESECSATLSEVTQTLQVQGRAAIRAQTRAYSSPDAHSTHLAQFATKAILEIRPSEVWIEGGKTASLVIRNLGREKLVAEHSYGDGIVGLRCCNQKGPLFVVKPGSYPWPASIPSAAIDFSTNPSVEAAIP